MARHVIAPVDELPPGTRKFLTIDQRPIAVFNIKGEFFGLLNRCPHQGAALCEGPLIGLAGMALILKQAPNARYLYPALPLISASFAALLGWMESDRRWLYRASIGLLIALTALNVYFMPSSSWYHKDFYLAKPFSKESREAQLGDVSPIRKVMQRFNALDEFVDPGEYYIRTTPLFEAPPGPYGWLADHCFVGIGERQKECLFMRYYMVL